MGTVDQLAVDHCRGGVPGCVRHSDHLAATAAIRAGRLLSGRVDNRAGFSSADLVVHVGWLISSGSCGPGERNAGEDDGDSDGELYSDGLRQD